MPRCGTMFHESIVPPLDKETSGEATRNEPTPALRATPPKEGIFRRALPRCGTTFDENIVPPWTRGAVKKFKIGSFRQEAHAGGQRSHAPAPPRWNARSARVFGCGSEPGYVPIVPARFFHSSRGFVLRIAVVADYFWACFCGLGAVEDVFGERVPFI